MKAPTQKSNPLSPDLLNKMNAYWRAANYLSVGQIYLFDNPLLKKPLKIEHVKPRLLGHWGTTPGLNFLYVHLNRVIKERDLDMIFIAGPGHGGPAMVANTYLEGSYSEIYSSVSQDEAGMKRLFKQFSFPGGIPSHVAPETPGSIHEGGELGYALAHAYGAAFDNPDLIVACVVGDGEAETGPLAGSWHANKFLNPVHDGAVLPILHLNGYKIANPSVLARISQRELEELMRGYGYDPHFVEGDEPAAMHQLMAATLDEVIQEIKNIQGEARANGFKKRPAWPMIVLRTPKGWTGPKTVDGTQNEILKLRSQQTDLETQRERESQTSEFALNDARRQMDAAAGQLTQNTQIISPIEGRVLEVKISAGAVLAVGTPVIAIESEGRRLEALIYIPAERGKNVKLGMPVRIEPSTVKREEFGTMVGTVVTISDFPITPQGMAAVLHNDNLVTRFTKEGAAYAATVSLEQDADNVSGYRWAVGKGPPVRLTSGTLTRAEITTRRQRPIDLVVPLFRRLTGIDG
jgi:phosphoketolase